MAPTVEPVDPFGPLPAGEMLYDPKAPIVYINGMPVPTGRSPLTAKDLIEKINNALATDYTGRDPRKFGMTKADAAALTLAEQAQDGDQGAFNILLDRTMGKPIQQNQNLNVTTSLKDFLDELNQKSIKGGDVFDIDPSTEKPTDPFSN